jgi:uncharacterized Fe-S cluster protein YjdI
MPRETLNYTNGEITVVWKPKACIHSALCWKGLVQVFNPRAKPWVKMDGGSTEQIIEQVKKCPSGALSYFLNTEDNSEDKKILLEIANMLKIEVSANGPYLIKSECRIVYSDGREETKTGTVALCRCGTSLNKPYCDGNHRRIEFKG